MKKIFSIVLLWGVVNSFAARLTPAQRKADATRQFETKMRSLIHDLEQDKSRANEICPQLCNNVATNIAPDLVCSVCWKTCKTKAAQRKNIIEQRMILACKNKQYPDKCCDLLGAGYVSKAQYNLINVKCKTLQGAAKRMQEQLSKELVQAKAATILITKLQNQVVQVQKTLQRQEKKYNQSLKKALDQKKQQCQEKAIALEKKFNEQLQLKEKKYQEIVKEIAQLKKVQKPIVSVGKKLEYGQYGYEPYKAPTGKEWQWKIVPLDRDGKEEWIPILVSIRRVPVRVSEILQPVDTEPLLIKDLQTEWLLDRIRRQEPPTVMEELQKIVVPVTDLEEQEIAGISTPVVQPQPSWWDQLAQSYSEYEPFAWGGLGA